MVARAEVLGNTGSNRPAEQTARQRLMDSLGGIPIG